MSLPLCGTFPFDWPLSVLINILSQHHESEHHDRLTRGSCKDVGVAGPRWWVGLIRGWTDVGASARLGA
jgi:hypothetical protein